MPRRPLVRVRDSYLAELEACTSFVQRCVTARAASASRPALTAIQIHWVYEQAFLKATVAWEVFQETALAYYVVGERAPSRRAPYSRLKHVAGARVQAVRETFRGDNEFVSWLAVDKVKERAESWLRGGGPFTPALDSAGSPLAYVKIIRNAVAHNSDSAWGKFEERTRRLYGSVPRGLTPGRQLSEPPPPSLGLPGDSLYAGITMLLTALGKQIAP